MAEQNGGEQVFQVLQVIGEVILLLIKYIYFNIEAVYRVFVPLPEDSVRGEIVLVTGAGHGIGKEFALQYADLGAIVVCWDVNEETNTKTVNEIKKKGQKAFGYVCDVSSRQKVFEVVEQVKKEVGDVSIIVNNAGIMPTHPMLEHTEKEIERIFGINVLAHFWIMQALLPGMIRNKHGHIVALASCAGLMGIENLVPYCASKFAVVGMMEALHHELKNTYPGCNVGVTVVCPYMVDTGLCKRPYTRFESAMKMATPQQVASASISAQRQGVPILTIPTEYYYLNVVARTWPLKAAEALKNFLKTGLHSDLEQ